MAEPLELKRVCEQIILHPLEHRKFIDQLILHPPPLITLFEELHEHREDEGFFVESIRTLLYYKCAGDFMLSKRDEVEKILRADIKMLLELAEEHEKEKAKQQMVMMELEKKLMEYQKENKKLLELLSEGKQGMVNPLPTGGDACSLAENSSSLPLKITGVEPVNTILSTQIRLKRQLSEVKKENVILWMSVEEQKTEEEQCKRQIQMLLELADDREKEYDELHRNVIDLREKVLVLQNKNKKLLESKNDCKKENHKLQLNMIELENKLVEQQKEIKKLLELAEVREKENEKLQMGMIELEKELLALQTEVEDKYELQKFVKQAPVMNECLASNGMQKHRKDLIKLYKDNISPQELLRFKRIREMDDAGLIDVLKSKQPRKQPSMSTS